MLYCYRLGDGNEGNYPRFLVDIPDGIDPYAAICALVVNRYTARSATRRHIMREIQTDGEPDYGISATVYEGPRGGRLSGQRGLPQSLSPTLKMMQRARACSASCLDPAGLTQPRGAITANLRQRMFDHA